MPALSVFWGDTAPLIPRQMPPGTRDAAVIEAIRRGYGDVPMDVPIASTFGRYLIEYLCEHDFDVAHMRYVKQPYGGSIARRYPTRQGELNYVRETPPRDQGLPHAFSFIVKRLFDNNPRPILPVFQNTCYHPNQPTPRRAFATGEAIAAAIAEWKEPASVAVIASGGLSHFVVDENLDRTLAQRARSSATPRAARDSAHAALLGRVRGAQLDRARRRHAEDRLEDGAARLRAGLPHAGWHRRRLGVRALALVGRYALKVDMTFWWPSLSASISSR
jgi:hypothetical protein